VHRPGEEGPENRGDPVLARKVWGEKNLIFTISIVSTGQKNGNSHGLNWAKEEKELGLLTMQAEEKTKSGRNGG